MPGRELDVCSRGSCDFVLVTINDTTLKPSSRERPCSAEGFSVFVVAWRNANGNPVVFIWVCMKE